MRLVRPLAMITLKCQIDLTTDFREVRNEERERRRLLLRSWRPKNFEPHMFSEREAMAVSRSFS